MTDVEVKEETAMDKQCVLLYRDIIEWEDGRIEVSTPTVLRGPNTEYGEGEILNFATDQEALAYFLDSLEDGCRLQGQRDCFAQDVTESEQYFGEGTVVRHSWRDRHYDMVDRLYLVTTMPCEEFDGECGNDW